MRKWETLHGSVPGCLRRGKDTRVAGAQSERERGGADVRKAWGAEGAEGMGERRSRKRNQENLDIKKIRA